MPKKIEIEIMVNDIKIFILWHSRMIVVVAGAFRQSKNSYDIYYKEIEIKRQELRR